MRIRLSLPFKGQCVTHIVALAVVTAFCLTAIANENKETDYRFWQQTQVRGVVSDAKGNPIPDITIIVKGGTATAISGSDGSFAINAKPGDILVFSGVSFGAKEVRVGNESNYRVTLTELVTTLSDVVVVGYGRSSKKTLSSSITTIKPEELNRGAIADVGQLLQGKVAGLNITASGDPNRPAAVILRGASTVNSPGGPFYVIDGVPLTVSEVGGYSQAKQERHPVQPRITPIEPVFQQTPNAVSE